MYAKSIASYVSEHGVDGAEFDFEDFGDCGLAEMHCPPGWAGSPWMDTYALSQFAQLHRLTRAAMGPTKLMGIDLSTDGPLFTSNDSTTLSCFSYFTTMLYSVGEKGFENDKASITAFIKDKGLPKSKVLFGNGLQHSIKGVDLTKCGPLKPTDNSCGSQTFNGQALSEARTKWAVQNGFAGGFFFELNDDLLPNNSLSTMRWYADGLAAAKSDDVQAAVHPAVRQEPPHPINLTVYALRPYNLTGLENKDSGDAAGDIFFYIGDRLPQVYTRAARTHTPSGATIGPSSW
eukprot:COSAG06_NODE_5053_length_3759_cov_2.454645_3_plen_290_part_00